MNLEEYFMRLREMAAYEKRRAAAQDALGDPESTTHKPIDPDSK